MAILTGLKGDLNRVNLNFFGGVDILSFVFLIHNNKQLLSHPCRSEPLWPQQSLVGKKLKFSPPLEPECLYLAA